jgi:hypothetical protein
MVQSLENPLQLSLEIYGQVDTISGGKKSSVPQCLRWCENFEVHVVLKQPSSFKLYF